jgi:nicotinate-nucleotide pyrophosphorylase (carboxylating)
MISSSATLIELALQEDLSQIGDVTSSYFIPENSSSRAVINSRSDGVLSGVTVVKEVFNKLDPSISVTLLKKDSEKVSCGEAIIELHGPTKSILAAERTALNFIQHLSGIATLTAKFVSLAKPGGARIVDTRKTLPGWRALQKMAVLHGGGYNHRRGLFDRILVKDNHLAVTRKNPDTLRKIVQKIREEQKNILIEFEADTVEDALFFTELGADIVMLDNMTTSQLREAVSLIAKRARTEASGGVTLQNVSEISLTGVDDISIGALTHSAPALDIGLDFL